MGRPIEDPGTLPRCQKEFFIKVNREKNQLATVNWNYKVQLILTFYKKFHMVISNP